MTTADQREPTKLGESGGDVAIVASQTLQRALKEALNGTRLSQSRTRRYAPLGTSLAATKVMTPTTRLPTMCGWTGASRDVLSERRLRARAWVDLAIDVSVDDIWHACQVVDVSETGMMFVLSKALASRESHMIVRYDMHVSATEDVELLARPVWRRGAVQAARFVALGDGARRALIDIVRADGRSASYDVVRLEMAEAMDARARWVSSARGCSKSRPTTPT